MSSLCLGSCAYLIYQPLRPRRRCATRRHTARLAATWLRRARAARSRSASPFGLQAALIIPSYDGSRGPPPLAAAVLPRAAASPRGRHQVLLPLPPLRDTPARAGRRLRRPAVAVVPKVQPLPPAASILGAAIARHDEATSPAAMLTRALAVPARRGCSGRAASLSSARGRCMWRAATRAQAAAAAHARRRAERLRRGRHGRGRAAQTRRGPTPTLLPPPTRSSGAPHRYFK